MRPTFRLSSKLAITAVLSLGLCASLSLANAQGKMKGGMRGQDTMGKMNGMRDSNMSGMMSMEDEDELMPVAPSYPWAAPGNLDMGHWTDFTRKHMRPGSAMDAKMDKMRDKSMRNSTAMMMHEEDEMDLMPVAPSYPWAPPGNLDMNHWTDYTRMHMRSGSAMDAKMDKMQQKSDMMHNKTMRKP